MDKSFTLPLLIAYLLFLSANPSEAIDLRRTIGERSYHLGNVEQPEWQEFTGLSPHGKQLELRFIAQENTNEATLFLTQNDVKQDWSVSINGQKIGKLFLMEAPLTSV